MIPGKYNIVCPQGSTYVQQFTYAINNEPVDLTGYSARMQVREKYISKTAIISLDSTDGIVLGGEAGTIDVEISSIVTELVPAKDYVYDLELVSSGNVVTRLIEGKFIVTPEVTK